MLYPALSRGLLLGSLLLLAGCPDSPSAVVEVTPSPIETTPTPTPSPEVSIEATPVPPEISATAIGAAQLGMPLGDLKQALPDASFEVRSPYMVDFDAIAVSQDGEIQFYILYLAGDTLADTAPIQGLLTENSAYRTAAGIGPSSTVTAAEAAYGNATLSYNTENESREYVRFQNHPAPNMSFRTGSGAEAGIYLESETSFHETQEYRPDATIQSVMLVCLRDGCATPP